VARLLGPDANGRLVYVASAGALRSAAGRTAVVYAAATGSTLADLATYDGTGTPGAAISDSELTVDSDSLLPRFWFPDGADTVYVSVDGGTRVAVNADYDARLDAIATGKADVTHAATHAAAGADPVTLAQSQITGLVAALAALLPLAGGTLTGDLEIAGTDKGYRLRRGGSALDLEATGVDLLISNWSGTDYDGTQRSYARLSADALNTQWAGRLESVAALYGAAVHALDPNTGVAELGGKNGLTALRLCGYKDSAGAPASGTWATGDLVLDSAGAWHLCTAAGTPGTWT